VEGACTGTGEQMEDQVMASAPFAGPPVGCKRAGSAYRHSCWAAAVLATGKAGEGRGWS
jgi:hypothetical protein